MISCLRRLLCFLAVCILFAYVGSFRSIATEELSASKEATNISNISLITDAESFTRLASLFDGQTLYGNPSGENARFTLESDEGIGSLYFLFTERQNPLTITDNSTGTSYIVGEQCYLHDFVDLTALFGEPLTSVTVEFGSEPVLLTEVEIYTAGQVPESVQKWEPPAEGCADLLLLSAHGDDDQIFFAGIIPHYAVYKDYQVQIGTITPNGIMVPFL